MEGKLTEMSQHENSIEIVVHAPIYYSEDPKKVTHAVKNIFPDCECTVKDNKLYFSSSNIAVLKKLKEQVRSRSTLAVLKKMIYKNQYMDTTWFLLNKQAAFAGIAAIVEEEDETPLGPIKITIKNQGIEEINKWLES
jgi:predicted RNA binding protein with dsRBD fold (UPF0201 family)